MLNRESYCDPQDFSVTDFDRGLVRGRVGDGLGVRCSLRTRVAKSHEASRTKLLSVSPIHDSILDSALVMGGSGWVPRRLAILSDSVSTVSRGGGADGFVIFWRLSCPLVHVTLHSELLRYPFLPRVSGNPAGGSRVSRIPLSLWCYTKGGHCR